MKHPDVLYCIEHIGRELAIAGAVRHLSRVRHGLDVEVISLPHHAHDAVTHFQPKLLAVPGFLSRRGYGANSHLERFRGVPVLNLAIEQLLSEANRKYRMPKDSVARQDVLHAAAGDFYRHWLYDAGVPERNVVQIGSLPCQLYRPPYSDYFKLSREHLAGIYGLDADKPWVLLPENFSAAFLTRSHIRHRLRHGYDQQELIEYVEFSRKSFRDIIRWCAAAASEHEVELIIRPRPAMHTESFVEAAQTAAGSLSTKNLRFIKDGDIRSWVLASQLVVSSFSTVLLEAAVAGRPTLLLEPRPIPRSASSAWHDHAASVTNEAEFIDAMRGAVAARPDSRLGEWAEQNLLAEGDAIANLAAALSDIVAGRRHVPVMRRPAPLTIAWDQLRDGIKRVERRSRKLLRPSRKVVFGHDKDHFDQSHVESVSRRWAGILGDQPETRAA